MHIYMFWFQVLPVGGYPPMIWSHHGRQGPPTVLCFMSRHHKARCVEAAATHARHITQHTASIIHHISHIIQHTTCIIHHISHTYNTQHASHITYHIITCNKHHASYITYHIHATHRASYITYHKHTTHTPCIQERERMLHGGDSIAHVPELVHDT